MLPTGQLSEYSFNKLSKYALPTKSGRVFFMENIKQLEIQEIDLILGNGQKIKSGDRDLTIQKMSLGRILSFSKIAIQMNLDEDGINSENIGDIAKMQFNAVVDNAEKCAEIIAIATNKDYRNEKELGTQIVLIMDEMTPTELLSATIAIFKTADLANFMTSIFLMNGANRPTQAMKVEG